jgi:cold shock CspA family protein
MLGKVVMYEKDQQFGVIKLESGELVLVHYRDIKRNSFLVVGETIQFDLKEDEDGRKYVKNIRCFGTIRGK